MMDLDFNSEADLEKALEEFRQVMSGSNKPRVSESDWSTFCESTKSEAFKKTQAA